MFSTCVPTFSICLLCVSSIYIILINKLNCRQFEAVSMIQLRARALGVGEHALATKQYRAQ